MKSEPKIIPCKMCSICGLKTDKDLFEMWTKKVDVVECAGCGACNKWVDSTVTISELAATTGVEPIEE